MLTAAGLQNETFRCGRVHPANLKTFQVRVGGGGRENSVNVQRERVYSSFTAVVPLSIRVAGD